MNISRPCLRLPAPALIISCVALFSALGGGAYAASSLSNSTLQWHNAPSLVNGWSRYGNTYAPAGYAKDSSGIVHLRGGISGGSGFAFTLPPGDRPSHYIYTTIYTVSGSQGSLEIFPNGHVYPFGTGASGYSGLDGVSFVAGE